jgi:ribonuclease P protein component
MLPRGQRLRTNQEFQRVYRRGTSWAHPLVALHVLPQHAGHRIGISVSKKVGKAVCRNRVRRRLREIVRARLPEWLGGFDAVLVVRAAAAEAEFGQLEQAVDELSRRARLRREPGGADQALYRLPERGGRPPGEARRRTGTAGEQ